MRLAGALVLAVTVSPVLCMFFFKNLKPSEDNLFVRYLKRSYLKQLERCLRHRRVTLGLFAALAVWHAGALAAAGTRVHAAA